ncbi:hypothetical protein SAMN05443247_10545 [Bradyrhizobium erythrophlei]|jgi:hypothetical protein|nr:hypothetical protein SAMN05443247_10545 [Bradyrhizobium erythrophlei]
MRAWFSVPIVKGIRTGVSVNPNSFRSSDPLQFVSASGRKFWRIFAMVIWLSFFVWLIASRDHGGRISEWWFIVLAMVMATHYLFKRSLWLLFPLREIEPTAQQPERPAQ